MGRPASRRTVALLARRDHARTPERIAQSLTRHHRSASRGSVGRPSGTVRLYRPLTRSLQVFSVSDQAASVAGTGGGSHCCVRTITTRRQTCPGQTLGSSTRAAPEGAGAAPRCLTMARVSGLRVVAYNGPCEIVTADRRCVGAHAAFFQTNDGSRPVWYGHVTSNAINWKRGTPRRGGPDDPASVGQGGRRRRHRLQLCTVDAGAGHGFRRAAVVSAHQGWLPNR